MLSLQIRTLGTLDIQANHAPLPSSFSLRQRLLLVYLVEQRENQSRSKVARLLWPRVETAAALNSLRTLLVMLRKAGLQEFLEIDRSSIHLNPALKIEQDSTQIRTIAASLNNASVSELQAAADLYQGGFLSSISLDDWPELDDWALTIRAQVEVSMVAILMQIIPLLLTSKSDPPAAVRYARLLVEMAPEDEDVQLLLVRALAANSQIAEALQKIKAYQRTLGQGNHPGIVSPALLNLIAQLENPSQAVRLVAMQHSETQPGSTPSLIPPTVPLSPANPLPANITPPMGRQAEQATLYRLLAEGHRMISIVGIGGAGKTFFIRSQIQSLKKNFSGGIAFVDLRGVEPSEEMLLTAIAAALSIPPTPSLSLWERIVSSIAQASVCLILDNYEAFVPMTASLLLKILEYNHSLHLIVTSRQRLNLSVETVLPLNGLTIYESGDAGRNFDSFSPAVMLFIYSAQQVLPQFAPDEAMRRKISAICQQLGGLPLAIQLAACQIDFYGLDELAGAIDTDLNLLRDERYGRAQEHATIPIVLEAMWRSLSPQAADVLQALTLFASTWSREAMMTIVSPNHTVYHELVNASLLQSPEPGRFSLHPLVKRFAETRMDKDIDPDITARYQAYFLNLLDLGEFLLQQTRILDPEVFRSLQATQTDIFAAWRWAIQQEHWPLLDKALISLCHYLLLTLQTNQGLALLQLLLDSLPAHSQQTKLQNRLAALATFLSGVLHTARGDQSEGLEWRSKGIHLLEPVGLAYEKAAAYAYHANALLTTKLYLSEGIVFLRKATVLADAYEFRSIQMGVKTSLLYHAIFWGRWREVQHLDQQILQILETIENKNSHALISCCQTPMFFGDWAEVERRIDMTERYFHNKSSASSALLWLKIYRCEALAAKGDMRTAILALQTHLPQFTANSPANAPIFWSVLALYHLVAGEPSAAMEIADHAVILARQINYPMLAIQGVLHAAVVYVSTGQIEKGEPLLQEALAMGLEAPNTPLAFTALYHLATLHYQNLPQALYERIVKIAAISPALYYAHRLLTTKQAGQQTEIMSADEQDALWATDFVIVRTLVEEVKRALAISGSDKQQRR